MNNLLYEKPTALNWNLLIKRPLLQKIIDSAHLSLSRFQEKTTNSISYIMGVLTVTLDRMKNLRDTDGIGRSDPYVIFEVEKHRIGFDKYYGKKESSKKNNTLNPVYNEVFTWHGIPDDLDNIFLDIKVYDDDIGFDDKLGHAEVDLEHAVLTTSPKEMVAVIDKKRFKLFGQEATIHMHISFQKGN